MRGNRYSMGLKVALAIFTVALFVKSTWAADHETVLYSFQHRYSTDGAYPYTGVIVDAAGNLMALRLVAELQTRRSTSTGRCSSCRPAGAGVGLEVTAYFRQGCGRAIPIDCLNIRCRG